MMKLQLTSEAGAGVIDWIEASAHDKAGKALSSANASIMVPVAS